MRHRFRSGLPLTLALLLPLLATAACKSGGGDQNNNDNLNNDNLNNNNAPPGDGGVEQCDDGVDNDGDGLADCADPDCTGVGPCEATEATCDDAADNDGDGRVDCDDSDCRDAPSCAGQVETSCDDGQDNDGDGLVDCADPSCVGVGACEAPEATCDDGVDNDADGLTDCTDPDCTGRPGCTAQEVLCSDGVDNDADGLTDCADPDCGGAVVCEYPESSCADGRDNDGDGLTDCADPSCAGVGACQATEVSCADAADNDGDGLTDCADPDCFGVGVCQATEADCADGQDNDGDGLVDCADPHCDTLACGDHGRACSEGACLCPGAEATETSCVDGQDNDCDGLADCADPDCFGGAACAVEASCADGQDNDLDGLTDCADPDCVGVGACEATEATCDDAFDNDGDGLTDCADPHCAGVAPCQPVESTCDDAFDNDGDGLTDCADPHCDALDCGPFGRRCQGGLCRCRWGFGTELACGNGVDDDCDGLTDCADPDCAPLLFCTRSGETCAEAQPLPGPGMVLGTTAAHTADLDPAASCTGQAAAGPDRVYAITLQAGQTLHATLTPSGGWEAALYVTRSCATLSTGCLAGSDTGGVETLSYRAGLTGTVYVVVDGRGAADAGDFQLDLSITEAGDTCADPAVITQSTTLHGTNQAMVNDLDPGAGGCTGAAAPGADRIYQVELTYGYSLIATLQPAGFDGALYVLSECGNAPGSCLAGADLAGVGGTEVVGHACDTATQTVFLVVDSPTPGAGGAYTLDLEITEAGNDSCTLPALLPAGAASFQGDLAQMTNAYDPTAGWSCIAGAAPGPDAVYFVTLDAGETLTATMVPAGPPAWDGALYVMTGDCADPGACVIGSDTGLAGGQERLFYTASVSGTPVYLVVDSLYANQGAGYTLDTYVE